MQAIVAAGVGVPLGKVVRAVGWLLTVLLFSMALNVAQYVGTIPAPASAPCGQIAH